MPVDNQDSIVQVQNAFPEIRRSLCEAAAHRAEAWCGEPLLHEGEDPVVALAEGTVRRAALDAALAEMDRGLPEPSYEWKRDYALVMGLDRVLNDPQPKLASGAADTGARNGPCHSCFALTVRR